MFLEFVYEYFSRNAIIIYGSSSRFNHAEFQLQ